MAKADVSEYATDPNPLLGAKSTEKYVVFLLFYPSVVVLLQMATSPQSVRIGRVMRHSSPSLYFRAMKRSPARVLHSHLFT